MDDPKELSGDDIARWAASVHGVALSGQRAATLAQEVRQLTAPARRGAGELPYDSDPFAFSRVLRELKGP